MPSCPVPANDHEFPLGTTRPELFPEVHGENGAGTIEDGSQGGHKRCYHHGHHQAPESWKQKRGLPEDSQITSAAG